MNKLNALSYSKLLIFCLACLFSFQSFAQEKQLTQINGLVTDAVTGETLPFVNVTFVGASIGGSTDFDGKYNIETLFATDTLLASYVGYQPLKKVVKIGVKQTLNFKLEPIGVKAETVTIVAKKKKYRRKNNPAIILMKKAIANREKNRLSSKDYYKYEKYEKVELDLNNITDKFRDRKLFNKIKFIWDYADTSDVNGKPYLPFFMKEARSTVYFRKDPEAKREHRQGVRVSGLDDYVDDKSITDVLDLLYQDIDIYDNTVTILDNQFLSPFSPFSPNFYRYYIIDTVEINGQSAIDLAFIPINKNDIGFEGDIYLSNDSNYTVLKVELGIVKQINLNFVKDMKIEQDFQDIEGIYTKTRDRLTIDYNISKKGVGMYGTRTVVMNDFDFNKPENDSVFGGVEKIIEPPGTYERSEIFWQDARLEPLTETEEGIYEMVDTLFNVPAVKAWLEIGNLLLSGFKAFGPIDIGPVNTFYSFNQLEGFRLRLGGETNLDFHKDLKLEGYGVYGFKDKRFKYSGAVTYSFTDTDFRKTPRHYIKATYIHDTDFPGMNLQHINGDNFFLSFRRGDTKKMFFSDAFMLEYHHELPGFSYTLHADRRNKRAFGNWDFRVDSETQGEFVIDQLQTMEFGIDLRYAPNEQFVQGRQFRTPLYNAFPIITLRYRTGVKALGGNYDYHRLTVNLFKKFQLSLLGYANVEIEGAQTFNQLPYPLLHLPQANQTYAYQIYSYNMMNFLEFANDRYASTNIQWYMNGFFLNKIPLLKKLKFREVASFKMLYGGLSDKNNPDIDDSLVRFENLDNTLTTFTMDGRPYIEASLGIYNIFKIFRVDFVRRLTYLDNPNIPSLFGVEGLGIRTRLKVSF